MFIRPKAWVHDWPHVHVDVAVRQLSHVATRYGSMTGKTCPVMARSTFFPSPSSESSQAYIHSAGWLSPSGHSSGGGALTA